MANITHIRGDTRTISVTFTTNDGTPIDISGSSVFMTINATKDPTDDTSAVVLKEVTSHPDPVNGYTEITLDHADTNLVTPGKYYYDVQLVQSDGVVVSLDSGRFTIKPDITRRIT